MFFKHLAVCGVACVALLVAAPAGFAQSSAQSGYSTPAGSVQERVADDPRTNTRASSNEPRASSNDPGGLPFTGLDIGLIGAAGGILLAVGIGARRFVGSATP